MSTPSLSPRERQVVDLLCEGHGRRTYLDVAVQLGIQYATVRTHVARIMLRYPSDKRPRIALFDVQEMVNTPAVSTSAD